MTARAHLSEEAEQEEREERDRLRALDARLGELHDRRRLALAEVRKLADEQRDLAGARRPREAELERIHGEYVDLGHDLAEARRARDAARGRVQEALIAVREFRSTMTRGTRPDPATLKREIAALEHRQQTHALPLPEENALLARLRKLTQELGEAEHDRGAAEAQRAKLKELEGSLAARRAEFDGLTHELPRLKSERERRMESIRARLVDEGAVVASLREAARRREAAFERLQAIGKQIDELEQEGDRLLRNSKARRQEARHVLQEYNRSVRGGVDPELAQQRSVDGRLEELLKRGKVVLR